MTYLYLIEKILSIVMLNFISSHICSIYIIIIPTIPKYLQMSLTKVLYMFHKIHVLLILGSLFSLYNFYLIVITLSIFNNIVLSKVIINIYFINFSIISFTKVSNDMYITSKYCNEYISISCVM